MPRAHGVRGRGGGRAATSPIAVTPVEKAQELEARKVGLVEKAQELKDMDSENVAVAMICSSIDGLGGATYWPSMDEARRVMGILFALPEQKRITEDHANHVTRLRDAERSELAKVREGGIAAAPAFGPWERDLDGKPVEALLELLASIEVSQKAAGSRIGKRQPQRDESVAGEEDASGEVQGMQKQPQGADEVQGTQNQTLGDDEDDAEWSEEALQEMFACIEEEEGSPEAARSRIPERQPQPDESVAENLVAGEEDASGEVQGTQNQPQGADEVQGAQNQPQGADEVQGAQNQPQGADEVQGAQNQPQGADEVQGAENQPQGADEVHGAQNQPPGDDDGEDDAAWMEQLVEDLKEKPEPANAAPHDAGMIKYINVGGYVIEEDTYDFIKFDLGMFPPSLENESKPRLWPWGAPPPPR